MCRIEAMNALILVNGYQENVSARQKQERLFEELVRAGCSVTVMKATRIPAFSAGDRSGFLSEGRFDFCIDMDKDLYLAKAISQEMPLFNSYRSLVLSDDKMSSLLALRGQGIEAPLTIAAPLCYLEAPDPREVRSFLDIVEERLSYPLVYKACHGSLGRQVLRIDDRKALEEVYDRNKAIPHLYEKFLSAHAGHDYRVLVVGGKVIAAMERVNEKDFRSNIALGGKGRDRTKDLPEDFRRMAVCSAKALDLDYAGIDLAIGERGEPLFLEANGNAFLTEIEAVTGVNVAKAFVDWILEKLKA